MPVVIVRRADVALTPWKNGGGVTRELYVARDEIGQPLWRLSMALVEQSGPFSRYPGVRRALVVVRGDPMRVYVDGATHLLSPLCPLAFSGEAEASGELTGSPVEDFNVMAWNGLVPEVNIGPASHLKLMDAQALTVLDGEVALRTSEHKVQLGYGDTAILDSSSFSLGGEGLVVGVRLRPAELSAGMQAKSAGGLPK